MADCQFTSRRDADHAGVAAGVPKGTARHAGQGLSIVADNRQTAGVNDHGAGVPQAEGVAADLAAAANLKMASCGDRDRAGVAAAGKPAGVAGNRSEEHTSELQSANISY